MTPQTVHSPSFPVYSAESHKQLQALVDELTKERAALQDLCHNQNRMLASLVHDMRSPMGVILAASQIAAMSEIKEEKRQRSLSLIQDAARQLGGLIQDILDLTKLQETNLELSIQAFQLRGMLENLVVGQSLIAANKGITLNLWFDPKCPLSLLGDPVRLQQVLQNLLNNAIKFTHSGAVDVSVKVTREDDESAEVLFSVKDSGVGIDSEMQERIFEPFRQAHQAVAKTYGGTGLGLAICRKLVERMQGRIWVESQPGKGSDFQFTAVFQKGTLEQNPDLIELTGLRVLVIDEDKQNRADVEAALLHLKMTPVLAENGQEAIAALEEAWNRGSPYPFVICDLNAGGGDGFFVIEQIRPEIRRDSTLIITTETCQSLDLVQCRELGVRAYLVRPLPPGELEQILQQTLMQQQEKRQVTADDLITRRSGPEATLR